MVIPTIIFVHDHHFFLYDLHFINVGCFKSTTERAEAQQYITNRATLWIMALYFNILHVYGLDLQFILHKQILVFPTGLDIVLLKILTRVTTSI